MNEGQRRNIQAVKMKYLRRAVRVTGRDKIKNVDFRIDLMIQSALDYIEQREQLVGTLDADRWEKTSTGYMESQNNKRLEKKWI